MREGRRFMPDTAPPVTGEIEAKLLLADELEKRSPSGKFLVPRSQVELFDEVCSAAVAVIMRISLDRASVDVVRVTDVIQIVEEQIGHGCFSHELSGHERAVNAACDRILKKVRALSAVSIPRATQENIGEYSYQDTPIASTSTTMATVAADHIPLPPAGGWRDIAELPNEIRTHKVAAMFWIDWNDECAPLNPPMSNDPRVRIAIGLYECCWSSVNKATAWQPLPAPPASDKE